MLFQQIPSVFVTWRRKAVCENHTGSVKYVTFAGPSPGALTGCIVNYGSLNGGGECDPARLDNLDNSPVSVNTRTFFLASCPNRVRVTIVGNYSETGFSTMNQLSITDKLTLGQGAKVLWEARDFVNGGFIALGTYIPGNNYATQTLTVNKSDVVNPADNFAFRLRYTTCVAAIFVANGAVHAVDQVLVTGQ